MIRLAPRSFARLRCETRPSGTALVAAALAVLVLVQVPACSLLRYDQPKKEAKKRWDHVRGRVKLRFAQDEFAAGRVDQAASALKESLALDPTAPDAYVLMAKINLENGEIMAARDVLHKAAELGGTSPEIDYLLGVVAQRYGDLPGALSHYRNASELSPRTAEYVVAQAEVLVAMGYLDDAQRLLRSRWTDFERNATVRSLAGDIHTMLSQYEEAADAYREAALLAPDDPQRQLQLGLALARAGRDSEAVAVLAPLAARGEPLPWSAKLALGRACLNKGDAAAAREVFRKATEEHASEPGAWLWLGRAALSGGDLLTARRATEKACSLAPTDSSNWLLLGYVARAQRDHDRAREAFTAALQLHPNDPMTHCLLGRTLEAIGNKTEAISHYQQAAKADPGYLWARQLLAAAGGAG